MLCPALPPPKKKPGKPSPLVFRERNVNEKSSSLTRRHPQDLASKGVTAEKWASAVTEVIGRKAGGKEPTRQGQGTEAHRIDEAVAVAERWLAEKLKL